MNRKYYFYIILVISIISYISYTIYDEYFDNTPPAILKADNSPWKIKPKPEDDFKNSKYNPVYDQIKEQKFNIKSSKLLPSPEKPIQLKGKDKITDIITRKMDQEGGAEEYNALKIISGSDSDSEYDIAKRKVEVKKYYVQVSSARNKNEAEKDYKIISNRYEKYLSGLNYKIIRYNAIEQNVYFKLLLGPVRGAEHAKLICKKLIQSGQSCIVKRM